MWREARRIFQGIRRCQQNQPRDQLNRHNRLLLLSSFPYLFCLILYRLHIRTGRFWVISLLHVLYVYVAAVRAPRSASVIQRSCTASTSQLAKLIPYTVEGLLGVTMKIRKRERKKKWLFFLKDCESKWVILLHHATLGKMPKFPGWWKLFSSSLSLSFLQQRELNTWNCIRSTMRYCT